MSSMNDFLKKYPPKRNLIADKSDDSINKNRKVHNIPIEATLDLHGLTLNEATHNLEAFLNRCVKNRFQKILIIHGKGLHSKNNEPILKKNILEHLNKHPLVYKTGLAKFNNGGAGASYVILKT